MPSILDYGQGFFTNDVSKYKNLKDDVHIALSGGRSSGAMLALLLELHNGKLPSNYHVIFTNTGKEHPATYKFLHMIETEWQVPVIWLEMTAILGRHSVAYKQVDYGSHSIEGEPFKALLRDNVMVPRRTKRICTFYMKLLTAIQFIADNNIKISKKFVGFRADEYTRLHNMQMRCGKDYTDWQPAAPLIDAGVNKKGVLSFWDIQPFNLEISSDWGNCNFCFMKSRRKLLRLAREKPRLVDWWVENDTGKELLSGKRYYMLPNGGYAALKAEAMLDQPDVDDDGLEDLECGCTD
jgi:hypothetical protein